MKNLSDRRKILKIHSLITQTGEPSAPVGSADYKGISGTLSIKSKLAIFNSIENCSGFTDLGSGYGEMCYLASWFLGVPSFAVEASETIHEHVEFVYESISRKCEIDHGLIHLVHKDIKDMTKIDSRSSHVFSFSIGMPRDVIDHMLRMVNHSHHVKQFILIVKEFKMEDIVSYFGKTRFVSIKRATAFARGSNQQHQMYTINLKPSSE